MPIKAKKSETFTDVVDLHVENASEAEAICFLPTGEGVEIRITYGELHARATALAALMQRHGAAGERALLATQDNIAFTVGFLACLYSGATVVPVPMFDLKRPGVSLTRVEAICADAKPRFFLTDQETSAARQGITSAARSLQNLTWLSAQEGVEGWQRPEITGDTLAFLQYTSGSTGTPKGVMITHSNLLANCEHIQTMWGNHGRSVFGSWLPQFHDFGLICMALESLYLGTKIVSMPPAAFAQAPLRWIQCLSKYRATVSAAPNFAFEMAVAKTTPEEREGLDLSALEAFACGAEPVRAATMRRFLEAFGPHGLKADVIRGAYGLAEATVLVSAMPRAALETVSLDAKALAHDKVVPTSGAGQDAPEFVACGLPNVGTRVAIVSPETLKPSPEREVGEIWVAGPHVSKGYFNRPEVSKENFGWMLGSEGGYLRTGDYGFMQNGHLYITGRRKDMLIIRGENYWPQDFEATLEQAHESIRPGFTAAFGLEEGGDERLVLVAELTYSEPQTAAVYNEILNKIHEAISVRHEMAPHTIVLIKKNTIPKTSSGKIQRQQCKRLFVDGELVVVSQRILGRAPPMQAEAAEAPSASRGPKYKAIEHYVLELLRLGINDLQGQRNLASYGYDSLDSAKVAQKIQDDWGVEVPAHAIPAMTVRELVDVVAT
ncbi:MAG TPA: AMP-binding protein [Myxococcota bacterium]|nr:AMP-binding protein [Myxococcota bacterium]